MKKDGLTIWLWTYKYEDDQTWNLRVPPFKQWTIATKKEFLEMLKTEQELWGANYMNVKKRHPTQEELKEYENWIS